MKKYIIIVLIISLFSSAFAQETFYDVNPKSGKVKAPQDTTFYKTSSDAEKAQLNKKSREVDENYFYSKDNKRMILVPSQTFIMGSDEGSDIEKPAHNARVQKFYMDETEVTNSQFNKFLKDSGYKPRGSLSHMNDRKFNADNQPVVDVDYYDAKAYAEWAGKRLPTEIEWECAARDSQNFEYATGNKIRSNQARYGQRISEGSPMPVKAYKPNSLGIYDLSGNVSEWVSGVIFAYPGSKYKFSGFGKMRVPRGGTWYSKEDECRTYRRSSMNISNSGGGTGFRCAIDYLEAQKQLRK